MDIRALLIYSDNTRNLLHQTLTANPEVFDRPFETLSAFKSIRQLVAHIIGAEERLLVRWIGGQTIEQSYEQRSALSIEGIFEDWAQIRANTHFILQGLDTAGLVRPIPIIMPQMGLEGSMTVEQFLFHMMNHQTYHLGQISMALQQMQIDPPYFDYMFLNK